MQVTRKCIFDGTEHTLELPITEEQIWDWEHGKLIQNAFPQLNADQREFLMTGIVPGDWDRWVGPEPEE